MEDLDRSRGVELARCAAVGHGRAQEITLRTVQKTHPDDTLDRGIASALLLGPVQHAKQE